MTGRERVLCAVQGRRADRLPRFFEFWPEFVEAWHREKGLGEDADIRHYSGSDMAVVVADETAWPTSAGVVKQDGPNVVSRSGWGVVSRSSADAKFTEELSTALPERVDPDTLEFDDPLLDSRYEGAGRQADVLRDELAVFCKTGGPYLRAAFMRGQEDFLMDIALDPGWVKAFVERVTDHITAVGVESIRRFGLEETGIAIYDDACTIHAPIMGPRAYEELFLPSLCKMVDAYRQAGAAHVMHHCDGYVGDLLAMWVAAGVDMVNPLEARTGPDPKEVIERFDGRLVVCGSLDNCDILPRGDRDEIRRHIEYLKAVGADGRFIVSPHSIGPDISVATMDYVLELLEP